MAGYFAALESCYACAGLFQFNPLKVPSLKVDGARQPICGACVALVNAKQEAKGLPKISVPEGSYAPELEEELAYA